MTLNFTAVSGGGEALLDLTFDQHQRDQTAYVYSATSATQPSPAAVPGILASARPWGLPLDMNVSNHMQPAASSSSPEDLQGSSPLSHASSPHSLHSPLQQSPFPATTNPLTNWALQQQQHLQQQQQQHQQQQQMHQEHQHHPQQQHQTARMHQAPIAAPEMAHFIPNPPLMNFNAFASTFPPPNPLDYLPPTTQNALQANLLDSPFTAMPSMEETAHAMQWGNSGMDNWHDFQNTLQMDGMARLDSVGSNSPTGTYLEVLSLPSSAGEGWTMVDWGHHGLDHFQHAQNAAIFNPGQTLHLRTNSDSSEGANSAEFGSYEEIQPFNCSPFCPDAECQCDHSNPRHCLVGDGNAHAHVHDAVGPVIPVAAGVTVKAEASASATSSTRHSPGNGAGSVSPTSTAPRRNSGPRKSPITKTTTKTIIRRTSNGKKEGLVEKKVGRRKGPLLPEQRKQASEIRKLRACLRCKFLKKTCDKGEPCAGCQPSHARLWQVPCTRIDIKDIGYFMKDWKADFEKHADLNMSVFNVKGFSSKETLMWITHGYGFALPVMVREVYVKNEGCFAVEWVETKTTSQDTLDFETKTDKFDVGSEGIRLEALQEYLDQHVDGPFEDFINDHFEGTPFITEILKTAHRYYIKDRMPVIKKALKLVLAYNLTMHITMVENQGSEVTLDGQIDDEESRYYGRTVAPVMINFQIKCALADMWRELQKDILEELSSLYSGVYSGEKMKNWPTIFMIASILLAVWEEMQFDCHYRVPDPAAVTKFCNDMETTPVGVIVGLFHAISQKLPAFTDWDTRQHGQLLHNNVSVCEAMTEVRQHVIKHGEYIMPRNFHDKPTARDVADLVCAEAYLRSRKESTKFDRYDFDSLSNKFLSKLVIRAN
ncbi:C6 finger domain-containing protein [Moelleriella libera RCEF 2490]|uniref:C6 finger domain-containing protein n=1 Tax=Moelleriella libera RCEF 2490 TaxID=1081109 RepID=A0A167VDW3_9HYPO|nr:C6 finger domain-containing protein [Moelleriella libera RCEF 2490]